MEIRLDLKDGAYLLNENQTIKYFASTSAEVKEFPLEDIKKIKVVKSYIHIFYSETKSKEIDITGKGNSYVIAAWLEDQAFPNPQKSRYKAKLKQTKLSKILFGLVAVSLIITIFMPKKEEPKVQETPKDKPAVYASIWDGSVSQVKRYVKFTLKDPDSYESIEWGKLFDLGDSSGTAYRFVIRHTYRARNSFGGYVVMDQKFFLDKSGSVIKIEQL